MKNPKLTNQISFDTNGGFFERTRLTEGKHVLKNLIKGGRFYIEIDGKLNETPFLGILRMLLHTNGDYFFVGAEKDHQFHLFKNGKVISKAYEKIENLITNDDGSKFFFKGIEYIDSETERDTFVFCGIEIPKYGKLLKREPVVLVDNKVIFLNPEGEGRLSVIFGKNGNTAIIEGRSIFARIYDGEEIKLIKGKILPKEMVEFEGMRYKISFLFPEFD